MAELTKSNARKPIADEGSRCWTRIGYSQIFGTTYGIVVKGNDGKAYEMQLSGDEMLSIVADWFRSAKVDQTLVRKPKT